PLPPTAGSLFCATCGRELPVDSRECPACGSQRTALRSLRPAEAVALGEVLPVGEMLAAASESWEETKFRPSKAQTGILSRSNLLPFDKRSTAEEKVTPGEVPPHLPARAPEGMWRRLRRAWRVLRGKA